MTVLPFPTRNRDARLAWLRDWERAISEVIAETPKIQLFAEKIDGLNEDLAEVQRRIGEQHEKL